MSYNFCYLTCASYVLFCSTKCILFKIVLCIKRQVVWPRSGPEGLHLPHVIIAAATLQPPMSDDIIAAPE
jgi:hypothetical protein